MLTGAVANRAALVVPPAIVAAAIESVGRSFEPSQARDPVVRVATRAAATTSVRA